MFADRTMHNLMLERFCTTRYTCTYRISIHIENVGEAQYNTTAHVCFAHADVAYPLGVQGCRLDCKVQVYCLAETKHYVVTAANCECGMLYRW